MRSLLSVTGRLFQLSRILRDAHLEMPFSILGWGGAVRDGHRTQKLGCEKRKRDYCKQGPGAKLVCARGRGDSISFSCYRIYSPSHV